ncbi:MAG TPA: DUF302 domain-containing protein [Acidimicrobiales bacterium]|jgi:uncharacterized protein (DUF302 family)
MAEPTTTSGIISKPTAGTVDQAVARLTALVAAKGMMVFAVIDHSGEARRRGLDLRDTKVVIFGSPTGGTPVMEAAPLAALDLPLKVLVWDDLGHTTLSYLDPAVLAERHRLDAELATRLVGIGPLTDELAS